MTKKTIATIIGCFLLASSITLFSGCSDEKNKENKKTEQYNEKEFSKNNKKTEKKADKKDNNNSVDEILNDFAKNNKGSISYAYNIYGKSQRKVCNSKKSKSASVIKIFIMDYAFNEIKNGSITLETVISGSSLKNLINLMITVSDNNATNKLIDYFTMDKLNSYFKQKGYNETELQRKMLDYDALKSGKDNYTSANDVLNFLDNLYEHKDSSPQKDMLDIMKKQTVATKIRSKLPNGTVIANKTGEINDVENDVGIVFTNNGDFAIVFITSGNDGSEGIRRAIGNATLKVYESINQK